jgi:hypothetical protein
VPMRERQNTATSTVLLLRGTLAMSQIFLVIWALFAVTERETTCGGLWYETVGVAVAGARGDASELGISLTRLQCWDTWARFRLLFLPVPALGILPRNFGRPILRLLQKRCTAASVMSQRERGNEDDVKSQLMLHRKKMAQYKNKISVYVLTLYRAMHARLKVKYC